MFQSTNPMEKSPAFGGMISTASTFFPGTSCAVISNFILRKAPLAKPKAGQTLHLDEKINPYYARAMEQFRAELLPAVMKEPGRAITVQQWQEIKDFFGPHKAWLESKSR